MSFYGDEVRLVTNKNTTCLAGVVSKDFFLAVFILRFGEDEHIFEKHIFVNGLKPPPFEYTAYVYIYISMSYCRGLLEMEGIHSGVFRECLLSLILRIADI